MTILDALKTRYEPYPQDSWFTVSYKSDEDKPLENRAYQVKNIADAASDITRHENEHVWTTMCVFKDRPQKKGTKKEFLSCAWLFVDLDGTGSLDSLQSANPTIIVESGRPDHYHGYWALTEPCTDINAIESRLSGLQRLLDSDPACTDVVRSLRLPGTKNMRTGKHCVITAQNKQRYPLSEFPAVDVVYPIEEVSRIAFPPDLEDRLRRAFKGTYVMERIYTEAGARDAGARVSRETGSVIRHKNDAHIARRMVAAGFNRDEIGAVLTHPNWFSGDKGNEVGWNYVTLTVNYAFNSVTAVEMSKVNVFESTRKPLDPKNPDGAYEMKMQFNPAVAAESIIERYQIKKHMGLLYYYDYNRGAYAVNSGTTIALTLKEALGNQFRMRHVVEVEDQIRKLAIQTPPDGAYINVLNGLLDVSTRKLIPHTPDVFILDQLPVHYDPDVPADAYIRWDKFVFGIASPADMMVLEEQGGHCLTTDTTIVRNPVALVLQGPRSSGKSELLQVVAAFLGEDNVSHVDLADLAREQDYYTWNLLGVRANIRFETSTATDLINTDRVKSIISEEVTEVRKIRGEPIKARIHARFFLATNDAVLTRKVDHALYKRMRIISCTHDWSRDPNRQPGAGQKLANDPEVLSAMLNRFLDGLDRLKAQGEFSETEGTKEAMMRHREENDSVEGWLVSCTEPDPDHEETAENMYLSYEARCADNRGKPVGKIVFFKRIDNILLDRPELAMTQSHKWNESHNRVRTFIGRRITRPHNTFRVGSADGTGHKITVPNIKSSNN